MNEKPPAGWYPDSTGTVRWWDGDQWTEHQPPPPPTTPPAEAASVESPPAVAAADDSVLAAAESAGPRRTVTAGRRPAVESTSQATQDSGSGKGLAMTALGVAIVSLLLCWIPFVNNVVFFLGVLGLVLSVVAYRRARRGKAEGRGMAFAAILISVLSLVGVLATQAYYSSVLTDIGDAIEGETNGSSTSSESEKDSESKAETLPLGESAELGSEYTVAVTKVNLDANKVVARANEFNEPPNGRYVIATLDVTYQGDEEGDPWLDLEPTFVGSDARQYDASACEAVVPDAGVDVPTLNSGGEATFKVCFDVPPAAIDEGELFVAETLSFDGSRQFWAIR